MMYRVIREFADAFDGYYIYNAGAMFPREGLMVANDRIAQLLGSNNSLGTPLIEAVSPKAETDVADSSTEKPVKRSRKAK